MTEVDAKEIVSPRRGEVAIVDVKSGETIARYAYFPGDDDVMPDTFVWGAMSESGSAVQIIHRHIDPERDRRRANLAGQMRSSGLTEEGVQAELAHFDSARDWRRAENDIRARSNSTLDEYGRRDEAASV